MALRRSDQIAGSLQDVAILSSLPDDDTNVLFVSSRTLYLLANLSEKEVWNYRSYFTEALDGGLVRTVEPDDTEAEFVDEVANRFALEVIPVDDIRPIISSTMYKTTGPQTIATGSQTRIVFEAEDSDPNNQAYPDLDYFVPQRAGRYLVTGRVNWASSGTGVRYLIVRRNGDNIAVKMNLPPSGLNFSQEITMTGIFNAGDIIELNVIQNTGSNLDIVYNSAQLLGNSFSLIGF